MHNEPNKQPINQDPKAQPIHPAIPSEPIHEPVATGEGPDPKQNAPATPGDL